MRKYRILVIALIAMISFNSCDKFLTSELTDAKKTSESYYQTPSDAYTALVGCYNGLDLIWNGGIAFPVVSEVLSDNCLGGTGASDGYGYQLLDEFDKSVSPSDVSIYSNTWKHYYQAIYRCNTLIDKIDQVDWSDSTALKNQYESEARFIRAFCYFDMARLWERVPLVTTPTLDNVAQAEPDSTYTQIMKDLRFAANNLPSTNYANVTSGRVTKWAAESLLARVYLFYSGYYGKTSIGGETAQTALAAVEDVIANSGHSLVSDYTTLWPAASLAKGVTYAGEDNPEVVFSIKYSSTGDYNGNITGNTWMVMEGIREESNFPYQYGWGACTVDPKLFNTFSADDSRRFASIIDISQEFPNYSKADKNREYTGYFLKKYSPVCDSSGTSVVADFQIGQYQDYFAIRYSDVLLMAAELGSPNAVDYYNQVLDRANPSATPVASVTEDMIMAQRRFEFAGEGIRYWDLLRQGIDKAAKTIAENTSISYLDDGGTPPSASQLEANIKATDGFQQIPNDQITLSSGTLKQNAGW